MTGLTFTQGCTRCRQPSTVLHSLGYCGHCGYRPVEPVPVEELAGLNPDLDQRGLARLQAFEQLIAEDDQACGYQDPED